MPRGIPLTWSDGTLEPDLPRRWAGSSSAVLEEKGGLLADAVLDVEEVAEPLRGEARAGDRESKASFPGCLLRGAVLTRELSGTSTPESPLPAALVSTSAPKPGIANIRPRLSANVALLDPLPAPLSGTGIESAIELT